MTKDAGRPQEFSLVKTTSCAASADPQAKESHQYMVVGKALHKAAEI